MSLGQGFFAMQYAFDRAALGAFTTTGLVNHVLIALGPAVVAYIAYTHPDAFDFEGSTPKRYGATVTFGAGIVVTVVGILTFVVTVVG